MARWIVAGLIVLNLVLGAGVYLRMENTAQAQIGKRGGNFATVAGQAGNSPYIYILEVNTGKLAALKLDVLNKSVTPAAGRNVSDDIKKLR